MSIAEKYFMEFNGSRNAYQPTLINKIFDEFGKDQKDGLITELIFIDGSKITTYGYEICEIYDSNGNVVGETGGV